MKKLLIMLLIVSAFFSPLLLKKQKAGAPNVSSAEQAQQVMPPLTLVTSLADSLPEHTLIRLGLQDVKGTKFKYRNGQYASYFQYNADAEALLRELAIVPFFISDYEADVACRKMTSDDLKDLRLRVDAHELSHAGAFFDDTGRYEAYEVLKPPFRHQMMIDRNNGMVIHRVTPT